MNKRSRYLAQAGAASMLLAAGCGLLHRHHGPQAAYRIVDLKALAGGKTSQVFDLSSSGVAVGRSDFAGSNGHQHAVVWEQDQQPRDLGTVDGGGSEADKVSPGGQIVGWTSTSGTHVSACEFPDSRPRPVAPVGSTMSFTFAVGDNNSVGVMWDQPDGAVRSAVTTGPTNPLGDLGVLPGYRDTMAAAMSTAGVVVGTADNGQGVQRAFEWTPSTGAPASGSLQALPLPAGYTDSLANAISPNGVIAGTCSIGAQGFHAVVWKDGQPEALSTSTGKESEAYAVDDAGDVVGECNNHACLWRKGHLIDLNAVTGKHMHTVFNTAVAITPDGEIACNGIVNKQIHAFLLVPFDKRS